MDPLLDEDEPTGDLQDPVRKIDSETLLAFMFAVLFAHIGLFATSLGLMLIGFRGRWVVGSAVVVVGALGLVLTVAVYRRYRSKSDA
ncbi:hypothetical protein EA462_01805 [Natrarchaeobius halalkaliphilus]|uniref:DUF7322 domain-containing protein n=1 Tax=Natrarchaeobius halalkaliphilus TaxID=1679091 RepID=A0A3N6MAD9_9EURY|nr:hypothetical protein EA462_01805 [Natrarchaeobius halalkaliphilus]